jgi:trimeric autotransporter adhesin
MTVTVTNPNATPLTNVAFSDTMPAGLTLVTQTGGTCSTLATGGGIFSINPGAGTFSSTSNVLAAGQSCNITVRVRGPTAGLFVNTTSTVTSTEAGPGGHASASIQVNALAAPTIAKTFERPRLPSAGRRR